jgi:hypothetical protein
MGRWLMMGTRSETVVWDGRAMVVLYKHWDGYPEHMVDFFRGAARLAAYMAKDQTHWLGYAEDVAGYIILAHGLESLKWIRGKPYPANTDFRPAAWVCDIIEYVYVLDVSRACADPLYWSLQGKGARRGTVPDGAGKWYLSVYEADRAFWRVNRRSRDAIYRRMVTKGVVPEQYLRLLERHEIELPRNVAEIEVAV